MAKIKYEYNVDGSSITVERIDNKYNIEELFFADVSGNSFCCGVVEIGGFTSNLDETDDVELFNKTLDKAVREFVRELRSTPNSKVKTKRCITTLIDSADCNIIRNSFLRTKTFRQVDSFTNPGSGNKVTIWVSC